MITEVNISEIKTRAPIGGVLNDIKNFMESEAFAAKIDIPNGRKPKYVRSAYAHAAKKIGADVKVLLRGDSVYLVKEAANGT